MLHADIELRDIASSHLKSLNRYIQRGQTPKGLSVNVQLNFVKWEDPILKMQWAKCKADAKRYSLKYLPLPLKVIFSYLQLPLVTSRYLQLPLYSYLQLPAVTSSYLQLPAVTSGYLQLPLVTCSYLQYLQLSTVTSSYLKLPPVTSSYLRTYIQLTQLPHQSSTTDSATYAMIACLLLFAYAKYDMYIGCNFIITVTQNNKLFLQNVIPHFEPGLNDFL